MVTGRQVEEVPSDPGMAPARDFNYIAPIGQ